MAENTAIEWADHTFNPWTGCTKVSPACDHCYAESWAKRSGTVRWGPGEPRRRTTDANWRLPLKWNAQAQRDGRRFRVFCASLADVFDNEVPTAWRVDLFRLIEVTPNLDWLLLTKRIGNAAKMMFLARGGYLPMLPNLWLGATVVTQEEADRDVPKLLAVPARVRFLSIEPMLGPIDLRRWLHGTSDTKVGQNLNSLGSLDHEVRDRSLKDSDGVALPSHFPDGNRLPAIALDTLRAPTNEPAEGALQPSHDIGVGVVDRDPCAVGPAGAATPVEIALAIKESREVGNAPFVGGDGDGLLQERGPGSPSETLASDFPLHAGSAGAKSQTNRRDGFTGAVGARNLNAPSGSVLHWVIVGGESGPKARPMHPDWARSLRDQCAAAGVPFLFKQWGEWLPAELPSDEECYADDGSDRALEGRIRVQRIEGYQDMACIGKKAAGRLLDGVEHNGFPA